MRIHSGVIVVGFELKCHLGQLGINIKHSSEEAVDSVAPDTFSVVVYHPIGYFPQILDYFTSLKNMADRCYYHSLGVL